MPRRIQGTQLLFSNAYSHVDLDGPITVTLPFSQPSARQLREHHQLCAL